MGYVRRFSFFRAWLVHKVVHLKAEKYVMHELYNLEKTVLDGYATYNFPKGDS